MQKFSHLLIGATESKDLLIYEDTHSVLARVQAFDGIKLDKTKFPPIQLSFQEKCFLLKKNLVTI